MRTEGFAHPMMPQAAPLLHRVPRSKEVVSRRHRSRRKRTQCEWALTLTSSLLFLYLSRSCFIASSMLSLIFFAFASR